MAALAAGLSASFLSTAAGVMFSFLLLGGVLLALRQAGVAIGWGIQFQQPAFLLVAAAAIGFFGLIMLDIVTSGTAICAETGRADATQRPCR